MSYEQDEFELLVSPQDYKLLQNKLKQREAEVDELKKHKQQLKELIMKFKEENCRLIQSNKKLEQSNSYLSLNGMKLSRELLQLRAYNEDIKVSCTQKELYFAQQYKESLLQNKKIEQTYDQTIKELNKTKNELALISRQFNQSINKSYGNMSIQTSGPKSLETTTMTLESGQDIKNTYLEVSKLSSMLEKQIQKNKESVSEVQAYKFNIKELQAKIQILNQEILSYQQSNKRISKKQKSSSEFALKKEKQYLQLEKEFLLLKSKEWEKEDRYKEKNEQREKELENKYEVKIKKFQQDLILKEKIIDQNNQVIKNLVEEKNQLLQNHQSDQILLATQKLAFEQKTQEFQKLSVENKNLSLLKMAEAEQFMKLKEQLLKFQKDLVIKSEKLSKQNCELQDNLNNLEVEYEKIISQMEDRERDLLKKLVEYEQELKILKHPQKILHKGQYFQMQQLLDCIGEFIERTHKNLNQIFLQDSQKKQLIKEHQHLMVGFIQDKFNVQKYDEKKEKLKNVGVKKNIKN